jgi:radical SAM modification target selenobiotic family peptide
MSTEQLKKLLAGLCIAGLISGASLTVTGCATPGKSA